MASLVPCFEETSLVLHFWIKQTKGFDKHQESETIVAGIDSIIRLYESVTLAIALKDLQVLIPRYLKRIKSLANKT